LDAPSGGEPRVDGEAPGVGHATNPLEEPSGFGPTATRRLSRQELRQAVLDLLGVDVDEKLSLLPLDPVSTPFDNNYEDQVPSAALLEGLSAVVTHAVGQVLGSAESRDHFVGCVPAGVGDEACLRSFIERFGRQALRRPLAADEVERYAAISSLSTEAEDFYVGVEVVARALLQNMEFLYRVELGAGEDLEVEVIRLTPWEVATRLSFLLWGSTPDDWLLEQAAAGALDTSSGVRAAAESLLDDPRALGRVQRMHAMWLGYEDIEAPPELAQALRRESDALVARTVFEENVWLRLFEAEETFVDASLAAHYGLPEPAGERGWVAYGVSGRRGLLSHGSVLANGQKFGRTSITQRGLYVVERLLCRHVPPPPPGLDVNVDEPPTGAGPCKVDNLKLHSESPACAGCHTITDSIGLGLEQYDLLGRYRTQDESGCAAAQSGTFGDAEPVTFSGPAELSRALIEGGELDRCFVQQLYSFALGRPTRSIDAGALRTLHDRFRGTQHSLKELLLEFVSSPAFLHRVVE
jgi:hypothetical protein